MKNSIIFSLTLACLWAQLAAHAETPAGAPVPVTVENFIRAESDLFFGNAVKDSGFGKFYHRRQTMGVDDQFVVRGNRDTLYSIAVFDLDAGPVTASAPAGACRNQG